MKNFMFLLLASFTMSIAVAQGDWATTVTLIDKNTVDIRNNRSCSVHIRVVYPDSNYEYVETPIPLAPGQSWEYTLEECASIQINSVGICPGETQIPGIIQLNTCNYVVALVLQKLSARRTSSGTVQLSLKVVEPIPIKEYRIYGRVGNQRVLLKVLKHIPGTLNYQIDLK